MHREVTSPSPSSRKKIPHAKSYRRTPEGHCFCHVQSSVNSFRSCCRFLQNLSSISPVATVAPCSLSPPSYPCAARSPGSLRASATSWWRCASPLATAAAPFAAAREAQRWTAPSSATKATRGHRVAIHSPVHAAVHRRELVGAERAPCRRRARTAVPSGTDVLHQARPRFSGGMAPVILHGDA